MSTTLPDQAAVDVLAASLIGLGLPPGLLTEHETQGRRHLAVFFTSPTLARRWHDRIRNARLRRVRVTLRPLADRDWKDAWKRRSRPFQIVPGLRVVPAWHAEARRGPGPDRLLLAAGMAFGTGRHATTRRVCQFLWRLRGRFRDVLDIGVGTGILTVAAIRFGATRVVGVDVDPEAVRVTRENLRLNGCRPARILHGDFARLTVRGTFDLVTANLGTLELLAIRRKILGRLRPGGHLAVSGMLAEHLPRFRREFDGPELRCVRAVIDGEWSALLYRRRR